MNPPAPEGHTWRGPATLVLIALIALVVFSAQAPPPVKPASAPPTSFSAVRALRDLKVIARAPHPLGTADNARVRQYICGRIRAIGLEPTVQTVEVARKSRFGPDLFATVNNVVTVLKGTRGGDAVMLVAHYDSVPSGPGAGDDGAAVAAMLETMRALAASRPLRNDVIFLFTDGEELGLIGAKGFVENYPDLKRIKAVLNFEGRGDTGPALMFETSNGNAWLIDALQAASYPRTSSLFQAIYKLLPNDTDFTVFKGAGMAGMNFAFTGHLPRYHTALDTVANLDPRSVQHHGSYQLALARRLGDARLDGAHSGDAIFFNDGGLILHYPAGWVVPLTIAVALLTLIVIALGIASGRYGAGSVAAGFGIFLGAIIVALIEGRLVWLLMASLVPILPSGTSYAGVWYVAACAALIIGTLWRVYDWLGTHLNRVGLGAGALLWLMLFMIANTVLLPGATYLFAWPLVFAALAMARRPSGPRLELSRALSAFVAIVPGIVLFVPLAAGAQDATRLGMSLLALIIVIPFALFIPYLDFLTAARRAVIPVAAAVAFIVTAALGVPAGAFSASRPRPDSIFYVLDGDSGTAIWGSVDRRPDTYTRQFLGNTPRRAPMLRFEPAPPPQTLAHFRSRRYLEGASVLQSAAPAVAMAPPTVSVVSDGLVDGRRVLAMHIQSARAAPILWMATGPGVLVMKAAADGKSLTPKTASQWAGWFWGVPKSGFDLKLVIAGKSPFQFRIADESWGLPEIAGETFAPRPADTMPRPFLFFGSATIVTRSYRISAVPASR